jgi:hypothetical protein
MAARAPDECFRRQQGFDLFEQEELLLGTGNQACHFRPQASHRDPRNHQLMGGPQHGREARWVERGEHTLHLVQAPDQNEAPNFQIPRRVYAVAVVF